PTNLPTPRQEGACAAPRGRNPWAQERRRALHEAAVCSLRTAGGLPHGRAGPTRTRQARPAPLLSCALSATPLAAARLRVQLRLAALFLGGPALGLALLIGGPALAYAGPEPKGVLLAGGLLIAGYGLLLLGALFPRRPRPQEDDGLPVERTNEPALAALVD